MASEIEWSLCAHHIRCNEHLALARGQSLLRPLRAENFIIMISSARSVRVTRFVLASSEHVPRRTAGQTEHHEPRYYSSRVFPFSFQLRTGMSKLPKTRENHDTATTRRPASFRVVASPFLSDVSSSFQLSGVLSTREFTLNIHPLRNL